MPSDFNRTVEEAGWRGRLDAVRSKSDGECERGRAAGVERAGLGRLGRVRCVRRFGPDEFRPKHCWKVLIDFLI